MSIFLIKTPSMIQFLTVSFAAMLCLLYPARGYSLEISTPVGVQQIGKHLDLKSTLSNMPEGAESQLRSTCLSARVNSLETSPGNRTVDPGAREVLVRFDPTIRRGGLLEFKSMMPINDALIEVELVSECPLVVFSTRWTLIMSQAERDQGADSDAAVPNMRTLKFDLESSSLLASSRRPPAPKPRNDSPAFESARVDSVEVIEKKVPATVPDQAENNPPNESAVVNEPVKVASVDSDLFGAGLIESRREMANTSSESGLTDYSSEEGLNDSWKNTILPASLAISALLVLGLIARKWRGLRVQQGKAVVSEDLLSQTRKAAQSQVRDPVGLNRDHVVEFSAEPSFIGSHRVLESLVSNDEHRFDEQLDAPTYPLSNNGMDQGNRSSLKISLELINRADIRSWILPASYLGLVESRNHSLELHRTLEALLLRSHIGLVELAFQDAKQGHATHAQSSADLFEQVLGDQIEEVESKPVLGVPDVVKSHVRAKMCEISGAEKRQLLRENLINLNNQLLSPALCFSTTAWREFLSEEGVFE